MIILQDTREKKPWNFDFYDCSVEVCKLDFGDYALKGHEHEVIIERKASSGEISNNLGKAKARFERELDLFADIKHSYIICEFTLDDLMQFPDKSGIPSHMRKRIRMNAGFMYKTLCEYEEERGIRVIYCPGREAAEERTIEIFREILG